MARTGTELGIFQRNGIAEVASQFYVIPFACFPQRSLTCAMTRQDVSEAILHLGSQVNMAGNVKAVSF